MADQTIEIKLVLRDELTRQLQPIIANLKQLNNAVDGAKFQQAGQHAQAFGRSIQGVRRELSTLASLTFGGIIGGGIVAGIVATGKALSDMANRSLQLRYIADSLGTQTSVLNEFSDAFMGLGKSQEEGASAIQGASKALRELQIEGSQSSLFKELERAGGASGRRIAQEMAVEMAGPRGLQGGVEHALRRMANMGEADAAKFGQVIGFGPGFGRQAARDYLEVLGQLPKRLELPRQQALELAKSNAAWGISWDNIKTTLGAAFIPTFAKITESLDQFLQSPSGQNFVAQLQFWGYLLARAVDDWLKTGGLERAAKGLEETVGYLKTGFQEADKVLKAMDISWPQIIAGLIGLRVLAPILRSIAAPLAVIAAIPGIATILAALAVPGLLTALIVNKDAIRDALQKQKESQDKTNPEITEETRKQGYIPQLLDMFWQLFRGNIDLLGKGGGAKQMSGDDTPKTEPERRADLDEKKRANRELTREFAALEYEMTKLNAYIQPGGPEGGGGTSGFQFSDGGDITLTGGRGGGSLQQRAAAALNDVYRSLSEQAAGRDPRRMQRALERVAPGSDEEWELRKNRALQGPSFSEFQSAQPPEGYGGGSGLPEPYDLKFREKGMEQRLQDYKGYYDRDWRGGRSELKHPHGMPINFSASGATNMMFGGGGGGGGGADAGGDTIINHLAGRDRGIGGSATVDIDVGGLGQPARNPASLFKPVPMGGIEQMQNITRPENNPLSQQ